MRTRGFTLIEMMIVVAIVGILTAVALPNLAKFQAKTKQSEAKTNLKSLYAGAKARFAEKDDYGDATDPLVFSMLGWQPEPNNKYMYVYGSQTWTIQATNRTTGGGGTSVTCSVGTSTVSPTNVMTKSFSAQACANIDSDSFVDTWMINTNGVLFNGAVADTDLLSPAVDNGNDLSN